MGVPGLSGATGERPVLSVGHTAIGWGFALILSELAPDRADDLLARGRA